MSEETFRVGPQYQIPDALWLQMVRVLPHKARKKDGRPRMDDRFQKWRAAQVFARLWQAGLLAYETLKGLESAWQPIDGAMTNAPLGGGKVGKHPTDRGKLGTKRSLLTDSHGLPLGVTVDGAKRHDMKLVDATLEAIMIKRPAPTTTQPQHLCLDKGYDYAAVRETLDTWGNTAHIRCRSEEVQAKQNIPGYQARRWVVERTNSWMNRFRRSLIR